MALITRNYLTRGRAVEALSAAYLSALLPKYARTSSITFHGAIAPGGTAGLSSSVFASPGNPAPDSGNTALSLKFRPFCMTSNQFHPAEACVVLSGLTFLRGWQHFPGLKPWAIAECPFGTPGNAPQRGARK
jgi:hypothetical protein